MIYPRILEAYHKHSMQLRGQILDLTDKVYGVAPLTLGDLRSIQKLCYPDLSLDEIACSNCDCEMRSALEAGVRTSFMESPAIDQAVDDILSYCRRKLRNFSDRDLVWLSHLVLIAVGAGRAIGVHAERARRREEKTS